jgi:hypothetical protein
LDDSHQHADCNVIGFPDQGPDLQSSHCFASDIRAAGIATAFCFFCIIALDLSSDGLMALSGHNNMRLYHLAYHCAKPL